MGTALVVGRVLHAWGLSGNPNESFGRAAGITLTWLTLLVALMLCIVRGGMTLAATAQATIG